MLHNTQKKFRFRNTRKKFSSRRQTPFQIKEKKKKETKKSNFIYMYLNDEKLMNCVNVFFTRTSRTRMRWYKNKKKKNKHFNQNLNLSIKCAIISYHFEFARRFNAQLHQFNMNMLWFTLYHWVIETIIKKILQIKNMIYKMQWRRSSRTQRFNNVAHKNFEN